MIAEVLTFWFDDHGAEQWWSKDDAFDDLCRRGFLDVHEQAYLGELWTWRDQAQGRLAEVIILDQFSRNIFRDTPQAFAYDGMALALAQEAVRAGADRELSKPQRQFLYMPYMHSESAKVHEEAVRLFTDLGDENTLKFERMHKRIIDRFGRYPHRNDILGRVSTADEQAFLQEPGSSF